MGDQPKVKPQVTCHQDSLVNDYTGYRKRIPMSAGSAGSASSSGRQTCRHHRCHYSGAWAAKPMFRANASNLLLPAQTIHHAPQYTTKVHDVLTCHKSTNKLSLKNRCSPRTRMQSRRPLLWEKMLEQYCRFSPCDCTSAL